MMNKKLKYHTVFMAATSVADLGISALHIHEKGKKHKNVLLKPVKDSVYIIRGRKGKGICFS